MIDSRRLLSLGLPVDAVQSLDLVERRLIDALEKKQRLLTTFVNPASVVLANRVPEYADILHRFDLVLPDGIGLAIACRWLQRVNFVRISFDSTSLAPVVFRLASRLRSTIVLVGGQPGVAEHAATQVRAAFPDVQIVATFHGFQDWNRIVSGILRLDPHIVICGMGGLAQEKLLLELSGAWQGVGFTCGGYLDQLHHGMRYYPEWINRMHARAAYRLWMEPRRLGRRYLVEYPEFGVRLLRAMVNNQTQ